MSEFHAKVFRVEAMEPHPNADTLSIIHNKGYPIVVKTALFKVGDLAIHLPCDAIMPKDQGWEATLGSSRRVKAKKIRNVFSMGMAVAAPPDAKEGDDMLEALGIIKYFPPVSFEMGGEKIEGPGCIPQYTDIEGLLAHPNVLEEGEQVVIAEKVDGANSRYATVDDVFWVGSHENFWTYCPTNVWWRNAIDLNLQERIKPFPTYCFFGELHGWVQKLRYGAQRGQTFFRLFDIFDLVKGRYLDWYHMITVAEAIDIPTVPSLYVGPWSKKLIKEFGSGKSEIADHRREGFVVRPLMSRTHPEVGRLILKYIDEEHRLGS